MISNKPFFKGIVHSTVRHLAYQQTDLVIYVTRDYSIFRHRTPVHPRGAFRLTQAG